MSAERRGASTRPISGCHTDATCLDDSAWEVRIEFGYPCDGSFIRFMSSEDARKLGQALIAAADHYESETARLAQAGAA